MKYKCRDCNKLFSSNKLLLKHKSRNHLNIKKKNKNIFVYLSFLVLILIIAILFQFFIIDSNQSEKLISESVGSLGSTHIHFDFKMYIDDELFDLTDNKYIMTNSYAHLHDDPPPKRGNIIHTHATNIDLQYFFDTLDIQITSECIITEEKHYCNTDEKKLKTYVKSEGETWILLSSPIGYVIQDLDKILISYGSTSQSNIELQKNSVTNFSCIESKTECKDT